MTSLSELLAAKKAAALAKQQEHLLNNFYEENEKKLETAIVEASTSTVTTVNPSLISVAKKSLAEIMAEKKKAMVEAPVISLPVAEEPEIHASIPSASTETFALDISLNSKQQLAADLAGQGKNFCLVGAAGTGKTTTQRTIAATLLATGKLCTHDFRIQGTGGERWTGPSIAFVAYTRIASGNLKRAIHKEPKLEEAFLHNITTIHNLLEYEPEFYWDMETQKEKMRFVPRRNSANPLDITHLVIEEASMVGLDLWQELYAAMRPGTQIIFLGDINQLPPVFGPSILNYALVQLPVVELTQVYRQKEGSTILDNAHKILKGDIALIEDPAFQIMRAGTVQHSQFKLAHMIGTLLPKLYSTGDYDPTQDIILSPFNKHELGTDNLNKYIAQFLGVLRNAVVYEVVAGITKCYLAVGDKVMYNKQVGEIVKINRNGDYTGKDTLAPSTTLTRFGIYTGTAAAGDDDEEFVLAEYNNLDLDKLLNENQKDDLVRSASHTTEILMETGQTVILSSVGDYSPSMFSLGYCLTVHKAQGCEWRRVFVVLHKDHSIMAFRELLYTAVTRAKDAVIAIAKDFMLAKAIQNPRIKGNTVEEKVEYFNAGLLNKNSGKDVFCTKIY